MLFRTVFIAALSFLLLVGCVTPPQTVALKPTVKRGIAKTDRGVSVLVKVKDERPRQSLGRRGSNWHLPKGEITSNQDLVPVVQREIVGILRSEGFQPSQSSRAPDAMIEVEIRLLELSAETEWNIRVTARSALKVVAGKKAGSYEKMYRSEREQRFYLEPTEVENEQLLNVVLSDALNQMALDSELINALTR